MQPSIFASRSARAFVSVAGLVLAGGLGVGAAVLAAADRPAAPAAALPAAEGSFSLDPVHSYVIFQIKHLGTSNSYGMFHEPSGKLVMATDPAASTLEISVPAEKVDTGSDKRDQHLRSPDFFSVKEFPAITFKSTSFKPAGNNAFEVTGDLTLHGVTKPVTTKLEVLGSGKGMKGEDILGAETKFTIKRSDWGMKTYVKEGALGDDVTLTVAIEAHKN
ncbi:MAG: YceI family protein [Phycisphaerales bacterium]|jgi:polyisoprenoid-binding protein YceI